MCVLLLPPPIQLQCALSSVQITKLKIQNETDSYSVTVHNLLVYYIYFFDSILVLRCHIQ